MFFVRIIDDNSLFVRDDFVDELTDKTIEAPCPNGFYLPKWDGEKWVEGGTAPAPATPEPTTEERLASVEAAITALMGV